MSVPESPSERAVAHPPETLEGWYVLHQVFSFGAASAARIDTSGLRTNGPDEGWSAFAQLIGSKSHLLAVHFRPTLDALGDAQRTLDRQTERAGLRLEYSFLSVTEA